MEKKALYTIGYSGLTPDRFVQKLKDAGVRVLVDVRDRPFSRKRGFSKNLLREVLELNQIEYLHVQTLGVPATMRYELRSGGNLQEYLEKYRRYLDSCQETLRSLHKLALEKSCCLMCVEEDVLECHRSVVAEALYLFDGRSLRVQHL